MPYTEATYSKHILKTMEAEFMSDYTQMLLEKVAQLEEAWTQKDKFIHSSRMIVKFREDHISRLEKKLKEGQGLQSDEESQALIDQLKEEIKILKDQVQNIIPFECCCLLYVCRMCAYMANCT